MAAPLKTVCCRVGALVLSRKSRIVWSSGQKCRWLTCGHQILYSSSSDPDSGSGAGPRKPLNLTRPPGRQKKAAEAESTSEESESSSSDSDNDLDPELVSAAQEVARSLGGESEQTASDLLNKLRSHQTLVQTIKDKGTPKPQPMKEVFAGMQVERRRRMGPRGRPGRTGSHPEDGGLSDTPPSSGHPRGDREGNVRLGVIDDLTRARRTTKRGDPAESLKLFQGPSLGIFTKKSQTELVQAADDPGRKSIFDALEEKNRAALLQFPTSNAFEEMIRWTEEGKMWRFPIDNEQGLDAEAEVGFHEHVFLEPLITDFPKRGPLRHFMELVCVGLSKNPYLTVQQKREHIDWFRQYFAEKKAILDEVIVEKDLPSGGSESGTDVKNVT